MGFAVGIRHTESISAAHKVMRDCADDFFHLLSGWCKGMLGTEPRRSSLNGVVL